jgi:hypothetical protein
MRNIFGSLFAIGVAGVAAVAANTAMRKRPRHIGAATEKPATDKKTPPRSEGQTGPPAQTRRNAGTPETQ